MCTETFETLCIRRILGAEQEKAKEKVEGGEEKRKIENLFSCCCVIQQVLSCQLNHCSYIILFL
jgi:hypothetical protein